MNVLHINEHLKWAGGVETYLLSLIPALEEQGHQQGFVYATGRPELVQYAHHVPELSQGTKAAEAAGLQDMRQVLDKAKPDLVHLHQVYNTGVIEACLQRVPVVVHAHDFRYLCPASTFYYKRSREVCQRTAGPGCFTTTLTKHCLTPRPAYALDYYRRVRWFVKQKERIQKVIAPSQAARQRYLQAGFAPEQVSVLPYFCPLQPLAQPRPLPERPTIVFVGRIRPNKGADVFVRALSRLPASVRGLMIGDFTAQSEAEIRQLAESGGCADRLELRGWAGRDSIRQAYEQASAFVFPSLWMETLGIVGIEALACGVPVVASDIGGVREWLLPGETGFLATPKIDEEFAQGINRLLESPELNRQFGEAGLKLVRERFSPNYHLTHLLEYYQAAIDKGPAH